MCFTRQEAYAPRDGTGLTDRAVTGGAGTLALECARALLQHGLRGLALLDMRPDQSAAEIKALQDDFSDRTIITVDVNVTEPANVDAAMLEVVQRLGGIDILACFAGVVSCVASVELVPEEWRRVLDVNTTGSWFCAQSAARYVASTWTIQGPSLLTRFRGT